MLGFSFDLRRRNAAKTVAGAASHRGASNAWRNHGQRSLSPPAPASALTSAAGRRATCSTAASTAARPSTSSASLTSNASLPLQSLASLVHCLNRRGQFRLIQRFVTVFVEFRDHACRQGFRIGDGAAHATARGFSLAAFSFHGYNLDDILFAPSNYRNRRHGCDGGSSREQSAEEAPAVSVQLFQLVS